MMLADKRKELERLLALVEEQLAAVPRFTWDTRHEHTRAVERLCGQLERAEGAKYRQSRDSYQVLLGGISSSSTMGAEAALRNWTKAVRERLELGGAA